MHNRRISRGGFALPTVLIASVVMLTILVVSVSSVAAVRVTLKTQYYEQLAKSAGEAGVAYAKACLSKNGNVPLWTDAKPLRPSTDCAGNSLLTPEVQLLVVAGGGSGGSGTGGGGGGGGVLYSDGIDVSATNYPIVVGAGGASPPIGTIGNNGANSSAFGQVAIGGGGGGYSYTGPVTGAGRAGGSGGGGQNYTAGNTAPGAGTVGQGYAGGPLGTSAGGGGGGAGGTGTAGSGTYVGGSGGPGLMYSISGTNVFYAGGGGGAGNTNGSSGKPGAGGATAGAETVASNATPNTGGGGGGGWVHVSGRGGAGGSGVVVIRYGNDGSINATGGVISYSGPYKIHTFTANGTFSITNAGVASCPTSVRCSVVAYDNIRSSFSVSRPSLNEQGKAVAIPNTGYVELLRDSTGEVWRTYRQPSVQAAVVPDLCSGAASSGLGWSNAVRTAAQDSIPNAPGAVTIALADNNLPAGKMFFRKDFVVTEPGSYDVGILTGSTSDSGDVYIDGVYEVNSTGSYASTPVTLSAGCHTITVQLSNQTVVSRRSDFTASIQRNNSAPILVSDTNWRVAAGASVHYSQPDFYADPAIWDPVLPYGAGTAQAANAAWQSVQNDIWTGLIGLNSNGCPSSCPAASSMYLRDSRSFYVATNTEVLVSALCDDDCAVYLDGEEVIANSPWSSINQQTLTLTAGAHHLAIRLYNINVGASGAAASVVVKDTGTVLTRTDRTWLGANTVVAGAGAEIYSYEASFVPSPSEIPQPALTDVLVVAGGGGGGGNCNSCGGAGGGGGGGVRFLEGAALSAGTYTVTVGAGGAAGSGGASRTAGGNGGNSAFGATSAIGGGGGGMQSGLAGLSGGSGGGGSGGSAPAPGAGGSGASGQGFSGGAGITSPYGGGGGGGASGAGVNAAGAVSGNGGAGLISYINGVSAVFGSGGGGGAHSTNYAGAADRGAGNGVNQSINGGIGLPGLVNTGGGGGGGNGASIGGSGGAGGSGRVVVRFKTGTKTVSATGTYTVSTPTIGGIPYTVYTFTGNGSYTTN